MRLSGIALFLRSRNAFTGVLLVVATAVVGLLLPPGLVAAPFREDALVQLIVVGVALPAAAVTVALRRPSATFERRSARLATARALLCLGLVGSLATVAALVLARAGSEVALVATRNVLLLSGLSICVALRAPAAIAWAPAAAYAGACVTFGTTDLGTAHPWALLLRPSDDIAALGVAAVLTGVAVAAYARRDLSAPSA